MIRSRFARRRQDIRPPEATRAFVDEALATLAAAGWSPAAWLRFFAQSTRRSWQQAQEHGGASCELLAEYGALMALSPSAWLGYSYLLAATHVGMLGEPDTGLGWANRLSLLRANLPAIIRPPAAWSAPIALASDWTDGYVARRTHETAFGAYADGFADVAFWCWYARHHEANPTVRRLAIAIWSAPVALATVGFFAFGRAVNVPRLTVARDVSVAMQILVTVRALSRSARQRHHPVLRTTSGHPATNGSRDAFPATARPQGGDRNECLALRPSQHSDHGFLSRLDWPSWIPF